MLVLLIIMMLIAPMLQKGVTVTLPEAGNTGDKPDTQDQTVVAIDARGKIYVNTIAAVEGATWSNACSAPRGQEGKDRLPQG